MHPAPHSGVVPAPGCAAGDVPLPGACCRPAPQPSPHLPSLATSTVHSMSTCPACVAPGVVPREGIGIARVSPRNVGNAISRDCDCGVAIGICCVRRADSSPRTCGATRMRWTSTRCVSIVCRCACSREIVLRGLRAVAAPSTRAARRPLRAGAVAATRTSCPARGTSVTCKGCGAGGTSTTGSGSGCACGGGCAATGSSGCGAGSSGCGGGGGCVGARTASASPQAATARRRFAPAPVAALPAHRRPFLPACPCR